MYTQTYTHRAHMYVYEHIVLASFVCQLDTAGVITEKIASDGVVPTVGHLLN